MESRRRRTRRRRRRSLSCPWVFLTTHGCRASCKRPNKKEESEGREGQGLRSPLGLSSVRAPAQRSVSLVFLCRYVSFGVQAGPSLLARYLSASTCISVGKVSLRAFTHRRKY